MYSLMIWHVGPVVLSTINLTFTMSCWAIISKTFNWHMVKYIVKMMLRILFQVKKFLSSCVKKIFNFHWFAFILLLFGLSILWITCQTFFDCLLDDARRNSNLVFLISFLKLFVMFLNVSSLPPLVLSELFSVLYFVSLACYWSKTLYNYKDVIILVLFSGPSLFKQLESSGDSRFHKCWKKKCDQQITSPISHSCQELSSA